MILEQCGFISFLQSVLVSISTYPMQCVTDNLPSDPEQYDAAVRACFTMGRGDRGVVMHVFPYAHPGPIL